ncbi:universal stress protein [Natrarchaeobaculum aegyptiacum]|uniref:Universal stress protein UspA n=1 Tax=Natrarchaeobaculum aegyptiacum TaxID=745377 RepID=A0A2Z2HW30_9EURY|nr:universal stress protein [Natrarchaeobaculum aegyptiacum]ARS91013.1 universal stress protein UspA [Natrarchaeobaculum aegyptiacum]
MSRTILVPVDGSPMSWQALEHALEMIDEGTIVALHVLNPTDPGYSLAEDVDVRTEPQHGSPEWYERAAEKERRLFEDVRERAGDQESSIRTDDVTGDPAEEIVDYVEAHDVDHVVIGGHGRSGPTRVLLGTTAELVVRRSPVPVTVVRDVEAD